MSRDNGNGRTTLPSVRCAIYTRKSTEEGLQMEFNSLDAQREGGEAYIASQRHEGWSCLPDRYDDGGFSGGSMDRPALKRLMADIEAGRVGCVVVYKVDRLSRSLLDFARLMECFDKHRVAFVSVTQQFNTASSMGRLILNVLLSFAQFEREMISERTRDKMSATRRKGKHAGGRPVLGYDVDRQARRLVPNPEEAARVREVFAQYLEKGSLLPVAQEAEKRGWRNKAWPGKGGKACGGGPLSRTMLHRLLTNPVYAGRVRHKGQEYPGEHPALVDPQDFARVQEMLAANGRGGGGTPSRDRFGALLRGLLRCGCCGSAMTPAHTTRKAKRYRYYACVQAQKRGKDACASRSVPAGELERVVVERLRGIGSDPAVLAQTVAEARVQDQQEMASLEQERRALGKDAPRLDQDLRALASELATAEDATSVLDRMASLRQRISQAERRLLAVGERMQALREGLLHEDDAATALARFGPVWEAMEPCDQARLVRLAVESAEYDGRRGTLSITFRASGIRALADEIHHHQAKKESA